MTREIWKQINDVLLKSYYVSNLGRFRNKSGKIIKQHLHKSGYLYVVFCVNGKSITRRAHRLVAATFCNGYEEGLVVNHIDHNKTNIINIIIIIVQITLNGVRKKKTPTMGYLKNT